jgi:hypothetical protein
MNDFFIKKYLLFLFLFTAVTLSAQHKSISIKDCPVQSSVDSLEAFISTSVISDEYQKVALLISMERSYIFYRYEKFGHYLGEIKKFADKNQDKEIFAIYYLLSSIRGKGAERYEFATKALDLFKESKDSLGIALAYKQLMRIYYGLPKEQRIFHEDDTYMEAAEKMYKNSTDPEILLSLLDLRTKFFKNHQKDEEYLSAHRQAEEIGKLNPSLRHLSLSMNSSLGLFYKEKGLYAKSLEVFKNMSSRSFSIYDKKEILQSISVLYTIIKDYKNAQKYSDSSFFYLYKYPAYFKSTQYVEAYRNYLDILKNKKAYTQYFIINDSLNLYIEKDKQEKQYDKLNDLKIQSQEQVNAKEKELIRSKQRLFQGIAIFLFISLLIFSILIIKIYNRGEKIKKLKAFQDQLITIIGHDIRSPMMATQGLTEEAHLLLKEKNYAVFPRIITSIEYAHLHTTQVLDNLINWLKVNQSELSLEKESINVKKFVSEISLLYVNMVQIAQSSIDIDIPTNITAYSNKESLAVILRNGIDNALKNNNQKAIKIVAFERSEHLFIEIHNHSALSDRELEFLNHCFKGNIVHDIETTQSFGVLLMTKFAQRINAALDINCLNENKTVLSIKIPKE